MIPYLMNFMVNGYWKYSPSLVLIVAKMVYTTLITTKAPCNRPAMPAGQNHLPNLKLSLLIWISRLFRLLKRSKPQKLPSNRSGRKPMKKGTLINPTITEYSSMLIWKFMACLPLWSTNSYSFLLAVQSIKGRIKFPKGIKYFEKVDACMIADKFLSCLVNTVAIFDWWFNRLPISLRCKYISKRWYYAKQST